MLGNAIKVNKSPNLSLFGESDVYRLHLGVHSNHHSNIIDKKANFGAGYSAHSSRHLIDPYNVTHIFRLNFGCKFWILPDADELDVAKCKRYIRTNVGLFTRFNKIHCGRSMFCIKIIHSTSMDRILWRILNGLGKHARCSLIIRNRNLPTQSSENLSLKMLHVHFNTYLK